MRFFKYSDGMTSWYGLYEGVSVLESINRYRFAIRQTEARSGVFECYFPKPDDDNDCIHITDISRERIISILEDCDELDAFLEEQILTEDDLRGEQPITAILMYLDDSFDIIDFFELQDENELSYNKNDVRNIILNSFLNVNITQHSFFDVLLEKRGLDRCPEYLWKIKVTDDEYQELKEYIASKIRQNAPHNLYERETALLYAEYHRREYGFRNVGDNTDNRPKALVFNSLGIHEVCGVDIDSFAGIAAKGADRLGIQLYTNDRTQYVFSLFYHGGLPLEKLTQNPSHPSWHRLIRYIIESDDSVDFSDIDDLVTGVIANKIDALKSFCQELQNAILTKDYHALPFYCTSENDSRFQMFLNLGQKALTEIRSKNPFRIQWSFEVNMNQKVIRPKFRILGPDSISLRADFLNDNHLDKRESFTISCQEDGNELANIVYNRYQDQNDFYGNRPFSISSAYRDIKNISVICPELDNPVIISEELDIDSPQIIREQDDGEGYEMTRNNFIGHKEVLVIVPEGWNIENESNYTVDNGYQYLDSQARIITLPRGIENQSVVLVDDNGNRKTISATVPLAKVIVMNRGFSEYVRQSVFYNVKNLAFFVKRSDDSKRRICREDLRFCSDRRTGEWLSEPPFGYIYVKSADHDNYADPIKILNLGNDPNQFRINYLDSDADSCRLSIEWNNGRVSCPNGCLIDNVWHLNRSDLEDSRFATFNFEPTLGRSFSLSVKTRFSDFQIYDDEDRSIQNDSYISLADLPRYRYHIQDINFKIDTWIIESGVNMTNPRNPDYTYAINSIGQFKERIRVTITDNNNIDKSPSDREILRESSLDNLFGGLEKIKAHFNRHQSDMRYTEIIVSTNINNRRLYFKIKKYPYIFEKNNNEIEIRKQSDRGTVSYNGLVKAMPLYQYEDVKTIALLQNENGNYLIPDEVRQWGDVLLYSGEREWVLPHSIDCMIAGERTKVQKDNALRNILSPMETIEYPNAIIWDETWQRGCFWFEWAYKEHIPASSLFDLKAIMSSSELMARLVLNMLLRGLKEINFNDYKVWLKRALLEMADENAFLWIWVHEDDYTFKSLGGEAFDPGILKRFLQGWYLYKSSQQQDDESKNENNKKLLRYFKGEQTDEDIFGFIIDFINEEFYPFIKDLRFSSMDHFLEGNSKHFTTQQLMERLNNTRFEVPDYIDDNIDRRYYNPREEEHFEKFMNTLVGKRPENFKLFYKRANMFFCAIRRNPSVDLFSYRPSIRKSILYFTSYFKDLFINMCIYNPR